MLSGTEKAFKVSAKKIKRIYKYVRKKLQNN